MTTEVRIKPQEQRIEEPPKFDFRNLSLGSGDTKEKQERLQRLKYELLNDDKQYRVAKDVLREIKVRRMQRRAPGTSSTMRPHSHDSDQQHEVRLFSSASNVFRRWIVSC